MRTTRRLGSALAGLLVAAGLLLYYRLTFGTLADFAVWIDGHCAEFFCDFLHYFYVEGQRIFTTEDPLPGYFYSAPFALLLGAFRGMPYPDARWWWVVVEGTSTLVLFSVPLLVGRTSEARTRWPWVSAYVLAFVGSVPLMHNMKWGQISVPLVMAALVALWLAEKGWHRTAGVILAVPIAVKYYPGLFLVYFIIRKDWRALAACIATLLAVAAVTMAVLGVERTLDFQLFVDHALLEAERSGIRNDPNSQFFPHVAARWFEWAASPAAQNVLTWLGSLVIAGNVAILYVLHKKAPRQTLKWDAILLFGATPFWIPTAWPHYFSYLPAIQWFVFTEVIDQPAAVLGTVADVALLLVSLVTTSSITMIAVFGEWKGFSSSGCLFLSNLGLLLVGYRRAAIVLRNPRTAPLSIGVTRRPSAFAP